MLFLKRQLPLVVCFVSGLLLIAQFYVPNETSRGFYEDILTWIEIIAAFALLMGALALFLSHLKKITRQSPGWGYSAIVIVSMLGYITIGCLYEGKEKLAGEDTPFGWGYEYVLNPLAATMFALLAFFIASAAFRAFRAKTVPAAVLLGMALVIMFTSVPLGTLIWDSLHLSAIASTDDIRDWLLEVANVAGKRAILFGVSFGVIATSIRVILGIERAYLGSD